MSAKRLGYQWIPIHKHHSGSDLVVGLFRKFKHKGHSMWVILCCLWQEPEAEVRNVDELPDIEGEEGEKGLYRAPEFAWLCEQLRGSPKQVADLLMFLHDYGHLKMSHRSYGLCTLISSFYKKYGRSADKRSRRLHERMQVFWPKLLEFREGCFAYIKKDRKRDKGGFQSSQNTSQDDDDHPQESPWVHVWDEENNRYIRRRRTEKELREALDE